MPEGGRGEDEARDKDQKEEKRKHKHRSSNFRVTSDQTSDRVTPNASTSLSAFLPNAVLTSDGDSLSSLSSHKPLSCLSGKLNEHLSLVANLSPLFFQSVTSGERGLTALGKRGTSIRLDHRGTAKR